MYRTAAAVTLLFLAAPAMADQCRAFVNGDEVIVEADNFQTFAEDVKRREKLLNWPSRTWNRAWGAPVACDSGVLYDYLATTIPDDDIQGYCLTESPESGFFLVPGERNFRGTCKKTFCEKVNTTKEQGLAVASSMTATLASNVKTAGLNAIMHGSGAMIMTGSASSISTSLGTAGSSTLTALSAPAVLGAAAVSVVAVGGAVYMCSGSDEALPATQEGDAPADDTSPAATDPVPVEQAPVAMPETDQAD